MYDQKAQHVLIDISFEKYPEELDDAAVWKELGGVALEKGNFSVLKEHSHSFKPQGLSYFWLLSESHLSVHTWPEVNHIFLDLFSCGNSENTAKTIDHLIAEIEKMGGSVSVKEDFERGFVLSSKKEE